MKIVKSVARILIVAAAVTVGTMLLGPGAGAVLGSLVGTAAANALLPIKPKPLGPDQLRFKIDKQAPYSIIIGRTANAGTIVYRNTFGTKNTYQGFVGVLSLGPIEEIEALWCDKVATTFTPGTGMAIGPYVNYMWMTTQLGEQPEASALTFPFAGAPNWGASSKLSGLAAYQWTLKFDKKNKKFPAGEPQFLAICKGMRVYDPRLDSTYPGGAGTCRAFDESTYVWSENAALNALTFAMGRYQNGTLVAGGGLADPVTLTDIVGVDVAAFVEWANVVDANAWATGGVVTTSDDKWDVLRMIGQSGAGEVMPLGAQLSCTYEHPRTSIVTVPESDLKGGVTIPGTTTHRDRLNGIIPKLRLENHKWEIVPIEAIQYADYETVDGYRRVQEIDMPLVQEVDQAAQLAGYELATRRERDGIQIVLPLKYLGYIPGDCITLDLPSFGLPSQKCVIRRREIDPSGTALVFDVRTETDAKHARALALTGVDITVADTTVPDWSTVDAPDAAAWDLEVATTPAPMIAVVGEVDDPGASSVLFSYRVFGDTEWTTDGIDAATATRHEINGLSEFEAYEVGVQYLKYGVVGEMLTLGPIIPGAPLRATTTGATRATTDGKLRRTV